jgi:cytochrome c oxidase subunit 2
MAIDLLGLPDLASAHGGSLDTMLLWIHVMMVVLFVGWGAFFIFSLARFRRSRNPVADYAGVKSHASSWLEGLVVALEAVFLIGFSFPLWAARVEAAPAEADRLEVRVVAEQFAWNVHYPGADGVFGDTSPDRVDSETNPLGLDRSGAGADDITTINQLYLPVDRPAFIRLSSKDVIHSFGLQEMRVKQDAVPGLEIPVWFTPTVTTEQMRERKGNPEFNYEISCAQLCGLGHYRMRGFLTIQTEEEFQAWLDEQAEFVGGEEDDFWS